MGVFAQFERAMIKERTRLGVEQAIRDGAIIGRPSKLDAGKRKHLLEMINAGQKTQAEMAGMFGVNRAVICRLISKQPVQKREEVTA